MTNEELYIAGLLFENIIYRYNGQQFEDLFVNIMTKRYPNFNAVKAYGNEGDHKNDGFDKTTGTYYQVFAPENILKTKTIQDAVKKLEEDFTKLYDYWNKICTIEQFFFVINDKYNGVPARIHEKCMDLNSMDKYKNLKLDIFTDKDLEREFDALDDVQKQKIIGMVPSKEFKSIEIDALSKTIQHLSNMHFKDPGNDKLIVPEFNEKIKFNCLSDEIKTYLKTGSYQEGILIEYFNNEPGLNELIQKRFNSLYLDSKDKYPDNIDNFNDLRFAYILEEASIDNTMTVRICVLVLMAYYFSSCDIFEAPK